MKEGFNSGLTWVETRVAEVAAAVTLVMVFAVTIDVFMRYTFNSPLTWTYELISMYMLPAIVFLPLALVQRQSHHINVDLLYRSFSPAKQRLAAAFSLTGSALVMAAIAWFAATKAWIALANNEVVSGPIPWPVWIGPALLAFGSALYVLRALAGLIQAAAGRVLDPGAGTSERGDAIEEL
jgi:TRAP-type C4-dicarboxylate transport system permease small subunit